MGTGVDILSLTQLSFASLCMNSKPKVVKQQNASKRRNSNAARRTRRGRRTRARTAGTSNANSSFTPGQVPVAAAYATGQRQKAPRITSAKNSVRIRHRELVSSVAGTTSFTVGSSLPLNPGLPTSFPWLATQAQAWERYRFNSLRFEYFTRTGSDVPGSVIMVPDYDAADAPPLTEQIASSYEDAVEDAPWKDQCCVLKPASLHALGPSKFVRTSTLSSNLDIKTYDSGNFFLCTLDGTAVNWGKLWVEYDVTLMTPQLNPNGGGIQAAQSTLCTTITANNIFANPVNESGSNNLATLTGATGGGVMTFPQAGQYLVVLDSLGTVVTHNSGPTLVGGSFNFGPIDSGSGTGELITSARITVTSGATLTFGIGFTGTGSSNVQIAQCPPGLA